MIKCFRDLSEILTLKAAYQKNGRSIELNDLDVIKDGAIVFDDKKILWVGASVDIPKEYQTIKTYSLPGHVLTPEIVDSHTHLIFGGNRSAEYLERLAGVSYEDIAKRGGGILYTQKSTNETSDQELFEMSVAHIERIYSYGVGTIEIKSGYGLTYDSEYRLSHLIHKLKNHFNNRVSIFNTFMAAHAVPVGQNASEYVKNTVLPLMIKLHSEKIIDAVDVFHEQGYFSHSDCELIFTQSQKLGLPIKIHADELNNNQGAELACSFSALSADHLLKISTDGIKTITTSNTVATLLPGTAFFLGKPLAPARLLLDSGVRVALASDFNPGSCHCDNLILIAQISAKSLGMRAEEVWTAITLNAAAALGKSNQGSLEIGRDAKFSLFKTQTHADILYSWGRNFALDWKSI